MVEAESSQNSFIKLSSVDPMFEKFEKLISSPKKERSSLSEYCPKNNHKLEKVKNVENFHRKFIPLKFIFCKVDVKNII